MRTSADIDDFRDDNGIYYLWVEIPVARFADKLPDVCACKWRKTDVVRDGDGKEKSYCLKSFGEYIYKHTRILNRQGTHAVVLLAAVEREGENYQSRRVGVSREDGLLWAQIMQLHGFGIDKWMITEEKKTFLTESSTYDYPQEI